MSPHLHDRDKIAPLPVGATSATTHKLYQELSQNDTISVPHPQHPQPQTFTDTMALYSSFSLLFLYRSPFLATRNHHPADQSRSTFNVAALILTIALPFIMIGSGVVKVRYAPLLHSTIEQRSSRWPKLEEPRITTTHGM